MTPTLLTISAACLFDEAGRLLLVRKRDTQAFMLPGGKAEPGEDALAALTRELAEELNLSLAAESLRPLGRFRALAANEPDTWIEASVFRAPQPHAVEAAAELEELLWLAPQDTPPESLAPLLREQVLPLLWPLEG
ncbi:NUDIX domain-containing protein [Pseudomonas benzenivorans]|uniref:NUDIX domain-containing protein n=1 Tax=Pseudomonas benzenivorans TaxID=556533 RepID=A0ABZ0PZW0_9PSED|nr:NUDIX domain-containing protein [Pseudomonas benzenivorans]WPC06486.1 NUDIX domain-containing protein [Pseudomonas benzenivorans]